MWAWSYRHISEIVRRLAGDKDVEMFLLDVLAPRLDPRESVEAYLKLHEKYLAEAEELYSKGDLPQAGEKYWGAVAALLNAVAEKKGVPHHSHRDYALLINRLFKETREKEIVVWFRMAEGLHANFQPQLHGQRGVRATQGGGLEPSQESERAGGVLTDARRRVVWTYIAVYRGSHHVAKPLELP